MIYGGEREALKERKLDCIVDTIEVLLCCGVLCTREEEDYLDYY